MVLTLKKGASKKEIAEIEDKLYQQKSTSGFNARKHNGTLSLKEEPLTIQSKLRDEWERNIG